MATGSKKTWHAAKGERVILRSSGHPIPTGLADRLLAELEVLRWPAKNQRQGLSSERYLVLPSNIKSDAYGSLRALCAELMAWADPAYK